MKKINLKLVFVIFLLGLTLTVLASFFFPQGEMVSSGWRIQGCPLPFFEQTGKGCSSLMLGCFDLDFLPVNFLFDLAFWIVLSVAIIIVVGFFRQKGKK
ncbi:MAG: hypothetical protein NT067_04175 [Candidatus Diapherotrites archaeon]|nr:hypothetical protein [Candidatus Diapherotrites archaeon]